MLRRGFGTWVTLAVLLVLMIAAFASIMEMRFSPGDIYAHYSTKRSDPLGARAFYESLDRMPGVEVSRNSSSLQRIKGLDEDSALVLLGLPRGALKMLRAPDDSPVMGAVRSGARLVIVMNPGYVPLSSKKQNEADESWLKRREKIKKELNKKEGDDDEADDEDTDEDLAEKIDKALGKLFLDYINIELMVQKGFKRPEQGWVVDAVDSDFEEDEILIGLPKVFPNWYSQFRFKEVKDPWNEVARIEGAPVVVERPYGKGRIVITTDSYFASNEALWKKGDTSFLWWLIGGKTKVVFDETIHGSEESGGIMKLIRRYRLHGFFAGLLVFLILLAWSSGSSLVPGSEELERGLTGSGGAVSGEDASSGMVRMLRRSIRPTELLDQCVTLWQESDSRAGAALSPSQKNAMEQVQQKRRSRPKELSLSEAYGKLVQVLRKK